MKKVLIVSDSHKHNEILNKIFNAHSDIDTCIHCGDLQDNVNALEIKTLHIVRGNNDFDYFPQELFIELENYKLYITHGHMQDIEVSDLKISQVASEKQANIVLYGHTHNPKFYQKDNMHFINPGSVAFPRGGKVFAPTYAILTLNDTIECHFYNAKTNECIDDLLFNPQPKKKKGFFSFFKK